MCREVGGVGGVAQKLLTNAAVTPTALDVLECSNQAQVGRAGPHLRMQSLCVEMGGPMVL
jgi:hypothetical protein